MSLPITMSITIDQVIHQFISFTENTSSNMTVSSSTYTFSIDKILRAQNIKDV